MKVKSLEERVSALEQKSGVESSEIGKVKDEDSKAIAINDWIRKEYKLTEEIAILRKALKKVLDKDGIEDAEFNEYDSYVEAHKAKVKEESK